VKYDQITGRNALGQHISGHRIYTVTQNTVMLPTARLTAFNVGGRIAAYTDTAHHTNTCIST